MSDNLLIKPSNIEVKIWMIKNDKSSRFSLCLAEKLIRLPKADNLGNLLFYKISHQIFQMADISLRNKPLHLHISSLSERSQCTRLPLNTLWSCDGTVLIEWLDPAGIAGLTLESANIQSNLGLGRLAYDAYQSQVTDKIQTTIELPALYSTRVPLVYCQSLS